MSTRRTREESQVITRNRLIAVAAAVFARRGYRAATLAEIAEEAGYTVGAIYSNFATKEDLFLAAIDEHLGSALEEVAAVFLEAPTLEEAARRAGVGAMTRLRDDPDWFPLFVEAWAFALRDPKFRPRFALRQTTSHRLLVDMLEQRLEREGRRCPDGRLEEVALALKALYHGVALEMATNPGAVADEALGSVIALLLQGLVSDLPAGAAAGDDRTARRARRRSGRPAVG